MKLYILRTFFQSGGGENRALCVCVISVLSDLQPQHFTLLLLLLFVSCDQSVQNMAVESAYIVFGNNYAD